VECVEVERLDLPGFDSENRLDTLPELPGSGKSIGKTTRGKWGGEEELSNLKNYMTCLEVTVRVGVRRLRNYYPEEG
jgi:hypothetical protein